MCDASHFRAGLSPQARLQSYTKTRKKRRPIILPARSTMN